MLSSTSPSNTAFRTRNVTALVLSMAVLSLAASAFYSLQGNPEINYFKQAHRIKTEWAGKMTREHGPKVVIYGGSSCDFSINGAQLLDELQLPCVNLGRGAGMGLIVLTMSALDVVGEGDTLIVACEPALLTDTLEFSNLGVQFAAALHEWHWLRAPLAPAQPLPWVELPLALRPGGQHTITMLAKLLGGQPLYRYRAEGIHPSGWNQTPVRLPISGPPRHGPTVFPDTREFLRSLQAWCSGRHVRLAYSLPWSYCPPEQSASFQKHNLEFLLQIAPSIPILKDPRLGAYSVREHFSDTAWHLTAEGSRLRTAELGQHILDWQTWTMEELAALLPTLAR